MSKSSNEETSPDELMESFHGRSLKSIILFTVVIHAVLLLGTSVPFLIKAVTGTDTGELSEEERMEMAMKDAKSSLEEIAEEYGLNARDISRGFGEGRPGSSKKPASEEVKASGPKEGLSTEPELNSPLKKEIRVKKDGPEAPKVGDDDEDLFK